jgi:glycosyltransferase involved in cell wall biosynthesis
VSGRRAGGEAIVMSGWTWQSHNVPERTAIALSRAGWRVLYCENPGSFLRKRGERRFSPARNIEGFRPGILGQRLNRVPVLRRWQIGRLLNRVLEQARELGMKDPAVIYPHGAWVADLAREMKARKIFSVYICMDYIPESENEALAEPADLVLAILPSMYRQLEKRFGEKVRLIPQLGPAEEMLEGGGEPSEALRRLEQIPRPRLAYLGQPQERLDVPLLEKLWNAHPEWQFLSCGEVPGQKRANWHDLGWLSPAEVAQVCRGIDVGLLPYDCQRELYRQCVPLKLFDYFAAGVPVVSTPLVHLDEYEDLVYRGASWEELEDGIRQALAEPADDPRREKRREIARAHSPDALARLLNMLLTGAAA